MTSNELIVDLRGRLIATLDDFWDAVSEPCGLPRWFGRNLVGLHRERLQGDVGLGGPPAVDRLLVGAPRGDEPA
ncbi:hypothetical protein LNW73_33770 [Streptomyces sp. RKAG337]|nr:hypothetical protein [Streptomyces sp. RKAG337]MCM2430726.1 hypothetical protein [Streptomyces sp. RKAG337]